MKSPLSPGVERAASGYDSPLQFVMYLRNFCLYTNFSPPALTPSRPLRPLPPPLPPPPVPLTTARFIPRPRRFALISFLMSENYLHHLHASTLFDQNAPLCHPCLALTACSFATFFVTTCVTRRSHTSLWVPLYFLSLSFLHSHDSLVGYLRFANLNKNRYNR